MSQHIRRASLFLTLIFAITAFAETETALIIQPYSGSKKQHALSQIGHVKISADSLLVYSPANKVLGRNALADIRYIKYDDYIENPNGQCGDSLWWEYLPETHTLVFRGSGAMYDLTQSAPWALAGLRDSIWNIQFSDSMTTIANQAFIHCRELTEVTIPNSVTEIHSQAFEQCERLRKVTLPNTLMQLGASTFNNCYRLSDINIPSSLTEIASGAFYNCDSLSDIRLPNTITRIGESAFRHIESLVSITLPSSVTTLDDYVFADCWNLVSINLSNNITYIGGRVFENCGSLQTVVLPDSLEQILTETFRNCTSLTTVTFPEREVRIGSGLFNSCTSLTDVHLGEGTTSMEAYAFANCTSLRSMVLPSTMSSIEMSSFEYCTGLDTLTSLAKVPPYLGENAFMEVDSMIPVYVPARSVRSYHNHDRWSYFRNFIGLPCDTTFYANDTAEICEGETYTWHERVLTATGTYIDTLQTLDGCDSICTLDLTVNPTYWNLVNRVMNEGQYFQWRGRDLSIYPVGYFEENDTLQTIHGCDSIFSLHLTVTALPTSYRYDTAYLCDGETMRYYNDTILSTSGDYVFHLTNYLGGDSVVTLHLTVHQTYLFEETISICAGTAYIWHGRDLYQTGIYYDSLLTINGCDSVFRLTLTVNETYSETEQVDICEGDTYNWHGRPYTKKGTYIDTLQSLSGCDSVCTLILSVNSKYLIEDIVSVREDKLPYLWQGEQISQSGDYRKEYIASTGCDSIYTLHFTVTALPIYTVTVDADHGHVNGTGTYPEGTSIHLEAVPDEGFEFQMWSDGSTNAAKDFVVMQDTIFRAHFFMPEVEQEVVVDSIETTSVTIVWDTVPGAILYELSIYKNGRLIVTFQVDPDNNIINQFFVGPERLIARKDSTGGSSETLQVNVGGLEPGQDYTYSLDALDDDRSFVGAQSGTFTTEEDPENRLDVLFDDRRPQPRKVLQDGHLYIELPNGTRYNAEGQLIGN